MKLLEIALIAIALGCDAFAVGMGVGARACNPRQVFRLSFHFGLFQFIMPILGWYLGQHLVGIASLWAPWIAFALLFFIGAKMAGENLFRGKSDKPDECVDPTRGLSLVVLSLATSLDALGVGFSIGILGAGLLFPAIWIGLTAGVMTWTAMKLGSRLSERFGRWMELAGGVILMAIAVKLLL
ncbi:MAG: manganese efflux pump MntP family protein [Syntrophobacteraceae bacterium]